MLHSYLLVDFHRVLHTVLAIAHRGSRFPASLSGQLLFHSMQQLFLGLGTPSLSVGTMTPPD